MNVNNIPTPTETPVQNSDLGRYMLIDRGSLESPQSIARVLELKPVRVYEDFVDLGTAYMLLGNYVAAAESYEVAARQSLDKKQLLGALYNKSVALAYAGYMQESLRTTDLMVKIAPDNLEASRLRYVLYRYAGNKLGMMAASDHLISLDPSVSGEAILDPGTAMLVFASAVVVATSVTLISVVALVPPPDRKEVVAPLMEGYYTLMGGVSSLGTKTISQILLETIKK